MKKSFFKSVAIAAVTVSAFALSSCEDRVITETIIEELKITTNDEANNLINGLYPKISQGSGLSFLLESATEATVSFEGDDDADGPLVSQFDITPTNWYVENTYNRNFTAVGAANDVIERIKDVPDDVRAVPARGIIATGIKNSVLGGAKFVRALGYFHLVQLYGGVPIYTTAGASGGSRASADDVYKQIESDLKEAIKLLPAETSVKSQPSQGTAKSLLAKVYLTWATLASATPETAKLQKAAEYAKEVIDSHQYELEEQFVHNWGRFWKNGKELVFTHSYVIGQAAPGDGGNHQSHCAFSYGFGSTDPQHIGPASYDLYTKWDGNSTGNRYDQRRDLSYTDSLAKPNSALDKNPAHDSIYYFRPSKGSLPIFGKGVDRSYYEGPLRSPYERDLDITVIRYSEVLLIRAEALIELGQNLSEAKDLINQVRHRAYLNAPDGAAAHYIAAASQADLRTALRQERFNEFVYERVRWLDLVRWHTLTETIKTVVPTYSEYKGEFGTGTFFARIKKHLQAKVNAVTANPTKYNLFPIPQTAIEANPKLLPNNPGY